MLNSFWIKLRKVTHAFSTLYDTSDTDVTVLFIAVFLFVTHVWVLLENIWYSFENLKLLHL